MHIHYSLKMFVAWNWFSVYKKLVDLWDSKCVAYSAHINNTDWIYYRSTNKGQEDWIQNRYGIENEQNHFCNLTSWILFSISTQ